MLWDEVGVDAAAVVMSIEEVVDVESDGEAAIGVFATEVDDAAGGHLLLSIELFDQFFNSVHIVFVCIHILYVEGSERYGTEWRGVFLPDA